MNDLPLFPDHGDLTMAVGIGICDFCTEESHAPAVWRYPCKDFIMGNLAAQEFGRDLDVSKGDWGACGTCAELIEKQDEAALVDRAELTRLYPEIKMAQQLIISKFFRSRLPAPRMYVGGQPSMSFGETIITPE
jgi:hypothetical protein